MKNKHYVYILRSVSHPDQIYIGHSENIENRMEYHANPKPTAYTSKYAPWELETYIVFKNIKLAQEFEPYLKSHSGRAFLRKRLI